MRNESKKWIPVFAGFLAIGVLLSSRHETRRILAPDTTPVSNSRSILAQAPSQGQLLQGSAQSAQRDPAKLNHDGAPVSFPYLKLRPIQFDKKQLEDHYLAERRFPLEVFDLGQVELEILEFYKDDYGAASLRGSIIYGSDEGRNRFPSFNLTMGERMVQGGFFIGSRAFKIVSGKGDNFLVEIDPKNQVRPD